MKEVREFKWLATVENPELVLLWEKLGEVRSNQFIADLLVNGAERWEKMLKLRPKSTDSIEVRRVRILAKSNAQIPFTHRQLENMLNATYGTKRTKVTIGYNQYALWVDVLAGVLTRTLEMRTFLRPIVPANMTIGISNTQVLNQRLSIGGVVRINKRVEIRPVVSFGAAEFNSNVWAAGAIRRVGHTVIRS
jgi:hypothetical protein